MVTVRNLSQEKPRPVSVMDLTVSQIEAIEDETGVPMSLWGQKGSVMRVYRLVLAAGNGVDPESYADMTGADMAAVVSLGKRKPRAGSADPEA